MTLFQKPTALLFTSTLVLALNDHWLKYEPLWPRPLAGKLSDFLGLLVAPAILIALTRARTLRRQWFCAVSIAIPFCGINLSSDLSGWLTQQVTLIGLSWRLWPDPTDLVALVMLPFAVQLGGALTHQPRPHPLLTRLSVAAAATACIASADAAHEARAFLVNQTGQALEVEVSSLHGSLHCEFSSDLNDELLRHGDFAEGERYQLEHDSVLPLRSRGTWPCGVVRIGFAGRAVGVIWDNLESRRLPPQPSRNELQNRQGLLFVNATESAPEELELEVGTGVRVLELADDEAPLPDPGAAILAQPPRLDHSLAGHVKQARIHQIQSLGAGCLLVSFDLNAKQARQRLISDSGRGTTPAATDAAAPDGSNDAGADADAGLAAATDAGEPPDPGANDGDLETVHLCLDRALFPFELGDTVSYNGDTSPAIVQSDQHQLSLWQSSEPPYGEEVEVTPLGSDLVRHACGAIWQPLQLSFSADAALNTVPQRQVRALRTVLAIAHSKGRGVSGSAPAGNSDCPLELRATREWFEVAELKEQP